MTRLERRALNWAERNRIWLFAAAVSVLAALIRLYGLDFHSGDYDGFLRPWYDEIKANGGLAAIGTQVGNYNVLYQLCIALMTYLPVHPLTAYKGLSVLFDYLLAGSAALVARELTGDRVRAALAYAGVLLLPSVFVNSAYWAQCDSIYTCFLMLSVWCLLKKRDTLAFVCVAAAFQFKLQAIFILPFLIYLYCAEKRFSILNFLIIPAMSVVISLMCGRGPWGTFRIYLEQTGQHTGMALSFPNVWNLISDRYDVFGRPAVLLTIALLGAGLLLLLSRKPKMTHAALLTVLIATLWTCCMFLPNMHERYAYFLNVLLLVGAVCGGQLMGYAAVSEVLTLIMYAKCIWNGSVAYNTPMYLCAAVYVAAYGMFIRASLGGRTWVSGAGK